MVLGVVREEVLLIVTAALAVFFFLSFLCILADIT